MKEFLRTLLFSLESIEIKGKSNLDTLLGCMMAIEQKIAELDSNEEGETATDG